MVGSADRRKRHAIRWGFGLNRNFGWRTPALGGEQIERLDPMESGWAAGVDEPRQAVASSANIDTNVVLGSLVREVADCEFVGFRNETCDRRCWTRGWP